MLSGVEGSQYRDSEVGQATETTKVRKFGGWYGLILPKSGVESMAAKEGDVLYVSGPRWVDLHPVRSGVHG